MNWTKITSEPLKEKKYTKKKNIQKKKIIKQTNKKDDFIKTDKYEYFELMKGIELLGDIVQIKDHCEKYTPNILDKVSALEIYDFFKEYFYIPEIVEQDESSEEEYENDIY